MNFKLFSGDYHERKQARKEHYEKQSKMKTRKRKCVACNGSGRYDNTGSPKCAACNGTGKERYKSHGQ